MIKEWMDRAKKAFKEEEPDIIEMSEESCEEARKLVEEAKANENEYSEARDECGRLIGIMGPGGFERVDEHYEERMKLKKIEEKLDVIIKMLEQGDSSLFKY